MGIFQQAAGDCVGELGGWVIERKFGVRDEGDGLGDGGGRGDLCVYGITEAGIRKGGDGVCDRGVVDAGESFAWIVHDDGLLSGVFLEPRAVDDDAFVEGRAGIGGNVCDDFFRDRAGLFVQADDDGADSAVVDHDAVDAPGGVFRLALACGDVGFVGVSAANAAVECFQ